ncbi:MAG TPA: hypothetical protein VKT70_05040 [Stellaceae bacterium]|nr:hypothetical protein [Stellaceae bacterium]
MNILARWLMILGVVMGMGGAVALAEDLDGAPTPTYCPNGTPC